MMRPWVYSRTVEMERGYGLAMRGLKQNDGSPYTAVGDNLGVNGGDVYEAGKESQGSRNEESVQEQKGKARFWEGKGEI